MFTLLKPSFWRTVIRSLKASTKFPFNPNEPNIIVTTILTHGNITTEAIFALDTGASITVIDQNLATLLEIKPRQRPTTVITASGTTKTYQATADTLTALGQTQANAPLLITRLPPDSGLDGLLGLSFLKHYRLEINPHDKFIQFS